MTKKENEMRTQEKLTTKENKMRTKDKLNATSKKEKLKIQKQINKVLASNLCKNPHLAIDRHLDDVIDRAFLDLEILAANILYLRLSYFGITVSKEEFFDLMQYIEPYFYYEIKANHEFKELAKFSKKRFLELLTKIRKAP
jgi:hypothetical protein